MRSTLPKISIITPSYNQGQFLERTIQSVLNQGYPNLEYWVIDGGSNDNSVSILKKYSSQLKWISEKDHGQTDAINKGMSRATGDVVAYLNSDDVYEQGTLKLVGKYFLKHKNADWITGDYRIIDEHDKAIQQFVPRYKRCIRRLQIPNFLFIVNSIAQPSTFWRMSAAEKVGKFREDLRYCMDFDYWLRMKALYKLDILPEVLSGFRIHKNSKGGSQFVQQFLEEHEVVKQHTRQPLFIALHWLHAQFIIALYKILK